jgi:hypothetical protein
MPTSYPRFTSGLALRSPSCKECKHRTKFDSSHRRPTAAVLLLAGLASVLLVVVATFSALPAMAQSLQGSHESLLKQNLVASQHDYAYFRTPRDVEQAIASGVLVEVRGNDDFELEGEEVSYRYARPEVGVFLAQLGSGYHAACGERLVVTSLTRPITRQPWNASPLSVHPTGMAVDMRRSLRRPCRQWMESTLLALEGEGMIEATREHWPSHYHVAVFPDPLLLPGPMGDPNGVTRLAALHHEAHGILQEADPEPARSVHVTRSTRTGRLRISQSGAALVARRGSRGSRIAIRRTPTKLRHRASHPTAVPAVARHRGHAPASSSHTRTVVAR